MDVGNFASQIRLLVFVQLSAAALTGMIVHHLSWSGPLPSLGSNVLDQVVMFGVGGALFASSVLYPWLGHKDRGYGKGLLLVALSSISFWCATFVADPDGPLGDFGPDATGYMRASFVGAAIVLAGAKFILPLGFFSRLFAAGVIAAALGGLIFSVIDRTWGIDSHAGYVAHAAWHTLMATALLVSQGGPLRGLGRRMTP